MPISIPVNFLVNVKCILVDTNNVRKDSKNEIYSQDYVGSIELPSVEVLPLEGANNTKKTNAGMVEKINTIIDTMTTELATTMDQTNVVKTVVIQQLEDFSSENLLRPMQDVSETLKDQLKAIFDENRVLTEKKTNTVFEDFRNKLTNEIVSIKSETLGIKTAQSLIKSDQYMDMIFDSIWANYYKNGLLNLLTSNVVAQKVELEFFNSPSTTPPIKSTSCTSLGKPIKKRPPANENLGTADTIGTPKANGYYKNTNLDVRVTVNSSGEKRILIPLPGAISENVDVESSFETLYIKDSSSLTPKLQFLGKEATTTFKNPVDLTDKTDYTIKLQPVFAFNDNFYFGKEFWPDKYSSKGVDQEGCFKTVNYLLEERKKVVEALRAQEKRALEGGLK